MNESLLLKDFNHGITLSVIVDSVFMIFLIKMNAKDNRFNPQFCSSIVASLDYIINDQIPKHSEYKFSLIITGDGRYFSNGLDLEYVLSTKNPNQFIIDHYEPLLCKFLTLGIPTIALINGHAFAGGMCLALAQDYRVSYSNCKGLLSMNELLIKAVIPSGMLSVLRAKLISPQVIRDCIYARKWSVPDAHNDKIIDILIEVEVENENVLDETVKFAKLKAIESKYVQVLHAIKCETYRDTVNLLLDPKSDKFDPFRFALANKL